MNIKKCESFKDRFMGMMFLKEKTDTGYYFKKCHSIHTFFCKYKLDVVLLNKNDEVITVKYNLRPGKVYFFNCYSIIEFQSNNLNFYIQKDTFKKYL